MGVKTITITEEAYRLLARERTGDESFSQVIKRLANERGSLRDSLGGWRMSTDEDAEIFSNLGAHWKKTTTKLRGAGKKYS